MNVYKLINHYDKALKIFDEIKLNNHYNKDKINDYIYSIVLLNKGECILNKGESILNEGECILNKGESILNKGESILNETDSILNKGEICLNYVVFNLFKTVLLVQL